MMKFSLRLGLQLALTLALSIFESSSARALELREHVGINMSLPSTAPSVRPLLIVGATLHQRIASVFGLESGLFYLPRDQGQYTLYGWHLPFMLRADLLERFEFGVGGFYSHLSGLTSVDATGAVIYPTFTEAGLDQDELGLMGAFDIKLGKIGEVLSFVLETRYLFGLVNLDKAKTRDFTLRNANVMLAVEYGF